jgi:hypothetical protein
VTEAPTTDPATVDLEVAGVAHVRVVGASPRGVARIVRLLGASPVDPPPAGTPDLLLRYGQDLSAPLTLVGPDAGYGTQGFVLLRGPRHAPVRVAIPFDRVGPGVEIRCQGDDAPVPGLVGLLHLALVGRGILPLHASAFVVDGHSVLVAGWARGGKTELLASATQSGARYVGDEWIIVDPAGRLRGMPEPVRLRAWHLRQLPHARRVLPLGSRLRLGSLRTAEGALSMAAEMAPSSTTIRRVGALVREQAWVQLPPEEVFGPRLGAAPEPSHLILTVGSESGDYRAEEIEADEVIRRLVVSTAYELRPIVERYRAFRFAAPELGSANPLLEDLEGRLAALAADRLTSDVPAHVLVHPHPFDLVRLHAVAAEILTRRGTAAGRGRGETGATGPSSPGPLAWAAAGTRRARDR